MQKELAVDDEKLVQFAKKYKSHFEQKVNGIKIDFVESVNTPT